MKFVKRLNLNPKRPFSTNFAVEIDGRIRTDSVAELQLPSGTSDQRVQSYNNGQIRYNKDLNEIEAYVNGTWEILRTRRQGNIQFQTVATGDYISSIYGPLSVRLDPTKPQNVMLYVDNVYQVPNVNYTLANDYVQTKATVGVTNPGVTTITLVDHTDVQVGSVVGGDTGIAPGTTVVSLSTNTTAVRISSATLGSINASTFLTFSFSTGTYAVFSSPVPAKPIYALIGFDGYYPPFEI
jgi:hypothetical protein